MRLILGLILLFTQFNYVWAEQLRIGVIAPLTGVVAEYGQAMQNGILLARAERPADFSGIEFIFEDSQFSGRNATDAFKKLVEQDRVHAIYCFGVHLCRSVAPLAKQYETLLIAQSIDGSITKDNPYVIRFFNDSSEYAKQAIDYLKSRGAKRIAVVLTADSYLNLVYAALKEAATPDLEIDLLHEFIPTDMDFSSAVSQLKRKNYDALAVFLASGQISRFYRLLQQQQVRLETLGTNYFEGAEEFNLSAGSMAGAVFPNNYVSPDFLKRYHERYGNGAEITFAALAYEFALTLQRAQAGIKSFSSLELAQALRTSVSQNSSAVGSLRFHSDTAGAAYFGSEIVLKKITPAGSSEIIDFQPVRARLR